MITNEKKIANECHKVNVGYFHRWVVDKVPTMHASNAIPELESGNHLPRFYLEVLLKCKKCGAGVWMSYINEIDVTNVDQYFEPK